MKVLGIRYCLEMPFDSEGRHATGREILTYSSANTLAWVNEYEDWEDTINLPNTETEDEYFERYCEHEGISLEGRWEDEEDLGLDDDIISEELPDEDIEIPEEVDEDFERWFFGEEEGGEGA